MGRFVTSVFALFVAIGSAPLAELRAVAMQAEEQSDGGETGAGNQTPTDVASGATSLPTITSGTGSSGTSGSNANSGNGTNGKTASGPSQGNAATSGGSGDENSPSVGSIPAADGSPPPGKQPSFFETFLGNPLNLILLLFVVVYVFLLMMPKPGQKDQKAMQERLANLKKNDRVVLNSGIHGIVANINAEAGTVTVRVDESTNARLTVDRAAIRSVEA